MGKKYIIEKDDNESIWSIYADADGYATIEGVSLTPYTEPDLEQVGKEGYKEAREAGIKDGKCEAWEVAKKIEILREAEMFEIFGEYDMFHIMRRYTASEAIEKLKAYEQRQEEQIQVGDEVIYNDRRCVVLVTETPEKYGCVMDAEGERHGFENKDVEKTGRHFPEIAEVFAKMKESDNG